MSKKVILCIVVATLLFAVYVAATMLVGGDRRLIVPGETTDAHHQIELSCESCHGTEPFADVRTAERVLNEACRTCHEDELDEADDSHPRSKFRNPRMASYWEKLDARQCTSCHIEHQPEITQVGAVTVPMDFCVACHSEGEDDVRVNRPTHAGLQFTTCASSGCHNYHDNQALYEDFLVAHLDEPAIRRDAVHGLTRRQRELRNSVLAVLDDHDPVAPESAISNFELVNQWTASFHAEVGVNCTACHADDLSNDSEHRDFAEFWIESPSTESCRSCHEEQAKSFVRGRHGMREHPDLKPPRDPTERLEQLGLSGVIPDAMIKYLADHSHPTHITVGEARLPMRAEVDAHKELDCNSCHFSHDVNTQIAAVEACLTCHNDPHTRNYVDSPHHTLWQEEMSGLATIGSGVSCASCHMPKIEKRREIVTNHNQNNNLRPNEKMVKSVCLDCHGLEFSLSALADKELVERNFRGLPVERVESMEWVSERAAVE